ncbi:hypothetical protein AX282_13610 [Bacillus spizizenii]|nr:hypothetical protein AX282_13610 [Bacillus spizizenii]
MIMYTNIDKSLNVKADLKRVAFFYCLKIRMKRALIQLFFYAQKALIWASRAGSIRAKLSFVSAV